MKHFALCLVLLAAMLIIIGQTHGLIIHETATLGATGHTAGTTINPVQFLGSRFQIDTTTEVTHIGGHMGTVFGDLFGAIISLSGSDALPSGNPFASSETVASTTFNPGSPSSDFLTPLSVTLSAGYYALIFGSGQFSAIGQGFMTTNNFGIPGQQNSYLKWSSSGWDNASLTGTRFVVEGNPIPEPKTLYLMRFGLLGVLGFVIGQRRRAKE